MTRLFDWLEDRTGIRGLTNAALYEHIPGGARWRYVWGSTLMFAFVVQMVTGFFLWAAYSPSSQTAWESVYYIQHEMAGGDVLRGIHHYTAQTMIILLAIHMLQVIVDGAYRAPREVNFWIGVILLNLVLALSLTGYLLPWDQKGYWSTKVATSLLGVVPVVGPALQRVIVGGPDYGHHTLTRFFALHAGLLPMLMMGFIAIHVYVFRRHGLRHKEPARGRNTYFWPDQVLKDAVACLGVLLFVLLLVFRFKMIPGGSDHVGAELAAPADPSEPFGAARPEWYFLFLFQFLKIPYFAGSNEIYGAVVIPAAVMFLLMLMPLIGRWRVGHWFNVFFTMFLGAGMVLLTALALLEDAGGPRVNVPLFAKLGANFGIGLLSVLLLATLVLVPLFRREQSFRFNVIVLGSLLALLGLGLLIAMAGGGAAQAGPTVQIGGEHLPVQRLMLFGLLALLVLLFTVALFRDYPHAGEVELARGPETPDPSEADPGSGVRVESIVGPTPISLCRWEWHHRTRLGLLLAVIVAAVLLTATSIVGTSGKPEFARSVQMSRADADRVVELAGSPAGIPAEGAVWLLRRDAKTQGPKLFARHCASCHGFDGHDGTGAELAESPSAPDLAGFASREWIAGVLDPVRVDTEMYYGPKTKAHAGKMVKYVKEDVAQFDADEKAKLLQVIKALSAEAQLQSQAQADAADVSDIVEGKKWIGDAGLACTDCHTFHGEKGKGGPDLTGYGSRQWVIDIINNPAHPRLYGKDNDRMPAFGEEKLLTPTQVGLLADWLRGEWYERGRIASIANPPTTHPTTQPATRPMS